MRPKFLSITLSLRYFSKPISSFLDKNILTSFLFSNIDFARSSITGGHFSIAAVKS